MTADSESLTGIPLNPKNADLFDRRFLLRAPLNHNHDSGHPGRTRVCRNIVRRIARLDGSLPRLPLARASAVLSVRSGSIGIPGLFELFSLTVLIVTPVAGRYFRLIGISLLSGTAAPSEGGCRLEDISNRGQTVPPVNGLRVTDSGFLSHGRLEFS